MYYCALLRLLFFYFLLHCNVTHKRSATITKETLVHQMLLNYKTSYYV